jgi:hypothetical protein
MKKHAENTMKSPSQGMTFLIWSILGGIGGAFLLFMAWFIMVASTPSFSTMAP